MIDRNTLNPKIDASVAKLQATFGAAPEVAVVLGSGWAGAVDQVQGAQHLSYAELPAFPQPNAASRPMRQAAARAGRPDFISLWAGQALPLQRAPGSAAALVAALSQGWHA